MDLIVPVLEFTYLLKKDSFLSGVSTNYETTWILAIMKMTWLLKLYILLVTQMGHFYDTG